MVNNRLRLVFKGKFTVNKNFPIVYGSFSAVNKNLSFVYGKGFNENSVSKLVFIKKIFVNINSNSHLQALTQYNYGNVQK
jgi:hypothetical protein